jgi:protein SCO1/2
MRTLRLLLCALALATPARAETARPAPLRDVGYDQRLGQALPLDTALRDETGAPVRLRDYFDDRPVVLVPAYYTCPMLCPLVLNGLVSALRALSFTVGKEFSVVVFSFAPSDTADLAAGRKAALLDDYRRVGAEKGWHVLTGDEPAIRALTGAIGFRYAWDEAHKQYAHASGIVVATPDGRIARYLFGVEYAPRDLRLALVEASAGRIGTVVDQLLLFCFHYDATTGRYGRIALDAVRAGGVVTVLGLAAFVGLMLRRDARRAVRG